MVSANLGLNLLHRNAGLQLIAEKHHASAKVLIPLTCDIVCNEDVHEDPTDGGKKQKIHVRVSDNVN
jgi:hypothetical protein